MAQPVDFVGLNTFVYEMCGYDKDEQSIASDNTRYGIFNGVDSYIDIGHKNTWNRLIGNGSSAEASSKMTFSFWIRIASTPSPDECILSFGQPKSAAGVGGVSIELDGSNKFQLYTIWEAGGTPTEYNPTTNAAAISANEWTHVAISYNALPVHPSSEAPKFYINGNLTGSTASTPGSGQTWNGINSDDCYIGKCEDASLADPFTGDLDEVIIWNSILTAAQIEAIFKAGRIKSINPQSDDPTDAIVEVRYADSLCAWYQIGGDDDTTTYIEDTSPQSLDSRTVNNLKFGGVKSNTFCEQKRISPYVAPAAGTSFTLQQRSYNLSLNTLGPDFSQVEDFDIGQYYKNWRYSELGLPTTASMFTALMLKRNGPYGWSSWKQLRASENSIFRNQRKNNIITALEPPQVFTAEYDNGSTQALLPRYGANKAFSEPVVTMKYKPLLWNVGNQVDTDSGPVMRRFSAKSSLGNQTEGFANRLLNQLVNRPIGEESQNYSLFKSYYLGDALEDLSSPIDSFEFLSYRETIYPREINTFRDYARSRNTFYFPWNSVRLQRNVTDVVNMNKYIPSQSMWIMDADFDWPDRPVPTNTATMRVGGWEDNNSSGSLGILQNGYCQYRQDHNFASSGGNISHYHSASAYYARRHSYKGDIISGPTLHFPSIGVVAPTGMVVPPTSAYVSTGIPEFQIFQGQAQWQAGEQAGYYSGSTFVSKPKQPFSNTYAEYAEKVRVMGQDCTLVPSFRMSEHVGDFERSARLNDNLDTFSIVGAYSELKKDSSDAGFYETYSTTDFMKHFKIIKEDHVDFAEPTAITLACTAVKKFLPFEGFYPAQRTEQIAQQFYDSYGSNLQITSAYDGGTEYFLPPWQNNSGIKPPQLSAGTAGNFPVQAIIQPLFGPGLLFNAIKSGVAVDWPMYTMTASLSGASNVVPGAGGAGSGGPRDFFNYSSEGGAMFNERVRFETLAFPSEQLSGRDLWLNEPHTSASIVANAKPIGCQWDGQGDALYIKMVNNFLAEVPRFFLQGEALTQIASLPQKNPNFGTVDEYVVRKGGVYGMRIKMFRSMNGTTLSYLSGSDLPDKVVPPQAFTTGSYQYMFGTNFIQPGYYDQDIENAPKETFTMYSRPSAFGPETSISGGVDGFKNGINWPYTPPYYHGESWIDVYFKPIEKKKYTLHEIMTDASASYWRYWTPPITESPSNTDTAAWINQGAMQLSASIEFMNSGQKASRIGKDPRSKTDVFVDAVDQNEARWIIQTKWETPMLNFAHLTGALDITDSKGDTQKNPSILSYPASSSYGNSQASRGMWHQYGRIPQSSEEGVFLQVTDIPKYWPDLASKYSAMPPQAELEDIYDVSSLADLCGFKKEPKRLGEISQNKVVKEAVVAVPYRVVNKDKKFFSIPRGYVQSILGGDVQGTVSPGKSIIRMINAMKQYNFPPSMDFITYRNVEPFAMYIFEFQQQLSKLDLADIWQNLPPEAGSTLETQTVTINHDLLSKELLSPDEVVHDLRWMVFKVKQKAKTNYYDNIAGKQDIGKQKMESLVDGEAKTAYTYNWPYDFFSLVELVKIEADVRFSAPLEVDSEDLEKPKTPKILRAKNKKTKPEALKTKTKESTVKNDKRSRAAKSNKKK